MYATYFFNCFKPLSCCLHLGHWYRITIMNANNHSAISKHTSLLFQPRFSNIDINGRKLRWLHRDKGLTPPPTLSSDYKRNTRGKCEQIIMPHVLHVHNGDHLSFQEFISTRREMFEMVKFKKQISIWMKPKGLIHIVTDLQSKIRTKTYKDKLIKECWGL